MSEIDSLRAMLILALSRIDDLEARTSSHLGIDWGATGINWPHPNQHISTAEFGTGNIRADETGIQLESPSFNEQVAIRWLQLFLSNSEITTSTPLASVAGYLNSADNPILELKSRAGNDDDYSLISLESDVSANNASIYFDLFQNGSIRGQFEMRRTATLDHFQIKNTPLSLLGVAADFSVELIDGMLWYRSDTDKFRARVNGVTENLATESYAAPAALTSVDFLVGTASGDLSAEIVVGTTPGGELGGTWAIPTVDATHSGSTHAATQAAAEATAASALSTHAAAADPHTGYVLESLLNAKGDLISASTADTPALVTVGANNTGLIADSSQGAGLKWGWPRLGDNSTLTIATGVVTITSGFHAIDTQSAAASDDLDTINGGVTGQILVIHALSAARTVNVTEAGNCHLNTNPTVLDNSDDTLTLIYDGSIWRQMAFANNAA